MLVGDASNCVGVESVSEMYQMLLQVMQHHAIAVPGVIS